MHQPGHIVVVVDEELCGGAKGLVLKQQPGVNMAVGRNDWQVCNQRVQLLRNCPGGWIARHQTLVVNRLPNFAGRTIHGLGGHLLLTFFGPGGRLPQQ